LRDKLRSKEIWVVGAKRYCNPEEDLPQDFEAQRETHYQALKQPMDATAFITQLQQEMTAALTSWMQVCLTTSKSTSQENNGWIRVFLSSHSQSHSTRCGSKVRSASAA